MDFKNSDRAIYLQIADRIMDDISNGRYIPDSRIPSVRECAASVEVNANTVMRTFEYLDKNGIIYNKRGIGYFVSSNAVKLVLDMRRREFFDQDMPRIFDRMFSIGIEPDELEKLYINYIKERETK